MSKGPKTISICKSEASSAFDLASFCADSKPGDRSPVDDFFSYVAEVMKLGVEDQLKDNEVLGRVLLLALVSGTEMYFRTLLARLVAVCPLTRSHASDQMLSLGSVNYYGEKDVGFGLLENVSFSTEGELARTTDRICGFKWDQKATSLAIAVKRFEELSHLRHAAVHAGGELGSRNIRAIKVDAASRKCLRIRFAELQSAASTCAHSARAYNNYMFQTILQRWITSNVLCGNWRRDRTHFGRLLSTFRCANDGISGPRHANYVYEFIRPGLLKSLSPT